MSDFWAGEWGPREHCLKVVPLEDGNPRSVYDGDWIDFYTTLGEMGYRFRDAGHSSDCIVVSMRTQISPEHRDQLADRYLIEEDSGAELAFV